MICKSMEKTINILRQESSTNAGKVTELGQKISSDLARVEQRLGRIELFNEELKIMLDEIEDCTTILANRRSQKLEKDCERRQKRKQEIQNSLTSEKKKLHRSSN